MKSARCQCESELAWLLFKYHEQNDNGVFPNSEGAGKLCLISGSNDLVFNYLISEFLRLESICLSLVINRNKLKLTCTSKLTLDTEKNIFAPGKLLPMITYQLNLASNICKVIRKSHCKDN